MIIMALIAAALVLCFMVLFWPIVLGIVLLRLAYKLYVSYSEALEARRQERAGEDRPQPGPRQHQLLTIKQARRASARGSVPWQERWPELYRQARGDRSDAGEYF